MSNHPTAAWATIHHADPDTIDVTVSKHGTATFWLGSIPVSPVRDADGTVVDDLETIAAIGETITRQAERKLRELRNGDTDGIPDPCDGGSLPSATEDGPAAA